MKVVFALLFTLLLSESIYADITVGTEKPAASNNSNPYTPSNHDRFGSNPGVTHLDMHGINALPAPRAVQKGASGSRSTGSTSSNPGYTSNVDYLVRRNLLDVHGINALPAPQAVHTETLSAGTGTPPSDSKPGANNGKSYIPMPKTPAIALHGMLDSISQYPESSLVNNSSRDVTPKADSVEDSGEREIISLKHLPKNSPLMLHSMLDSMSRYASGSDGLSDGAGPSLPSGNKNPNGGGWKPPPPSSPGDGGRPSADVRGASGETTYMDANGELWSSASNWNNRKKTQVLLIGQEAETARELLERNPDSLESQRLGCRLSFW